MDLRDDYFTGTEGIDDYAKKVSDKVDKIINDGVDELVIVGYSMGGLVAAQYAEYYNTQNIIKYVYTVATPWHGVPLLNYVYGLPIINKKRHYEMLPDSNFLKNLRKKIKYTKIKYKTIGSSWDIIVPKGTYTLEGIDNIDTIFSHTSIIHMPSTWEHILSVV
jgi:esterase/lipase